MTLVTGKLERVSAPKNESKQSGTKQPVGAEYFGHLPTAKNTESTSFGDYRHLWGADVLCFVVFCLFDGGGYRNVKDGRQQATHVTPGLEINRLGRDRFLFCVIQPITPIAGSFT